MDWGGDFAKGLLPWTEVQRRWCLPAQLPAPPPPRGSATELARLTDLIKTRIFQGAIHKLRIIDAGERITGVLDPLAHAGYSEGELPLRERGPAFLGRTPTNPSATPSYSIHAIVFFPEAPVTAFVVAL